jgi:hypothetical protein
MAFLLTLAHTKRCQGPKLSSGAVTQSLLTSRTEAMEDEQAPEHPAVFLSHASEDNDRFARDLATKLQANGARVWFDEWELLPGDSLVGKIFDEGLKGADAMVVVLSTHSVNKPWVKEEIDAAFIKRIEGRCKLIPVVIDDVKIPEVLKSTKYQRVVDLNDYGDDLRQILRAIFGDRNRRPPGELSRYARISALPGLDSVDTRVLQLSGDIALEQDHQLIESEDVLRRGHDDDIDEVGLLESLHVLEEQGYVRVHATLGAGISGMSAFTITTPGFDSYLRGCRAGYDQTVERIAGDLVNAGSGSDRAIADRVGAPRVVVEHIFDLFDAQGLVRLTKMSGPNTDVHYVSPQLKRALQTLVPE